jgi:hypothetical protein
MLTKSHFLYSLSLMTLLTVSISPVFAQAATPTNWETNQQNQINQAAAAGAINPTTQAGLQQAESQIQAQQQQLLNQNGNGTLTPQQKQQIDADLRGVNRNLRSDIRSQSPNGYPGTAPNYQNQWQRPQWQANVPPQWQNSQQQWQNSQQQLQAQNANPQTWQQHGGHHHHHNGNGGGQGYGGSNGYGNGANNYNGGNGYGGYNANAGNYNGGNGNGPNSYEAWR